MFQKQLRRRHHDYNIDTHYCDLNNGDGIGTGTGYSYGGHCGSSGHGNGDGHCGSFSYGDGGIGYEDDYLNNGCLCCGIGNAYCYCDGYGYGSYHGEGMGYGNGSGE